jgi:membrane-associated protease RseP (regulator of RpoE activity)
MRIYVAGSMANLSLAVVALIIMTLISSSVIPAVFHEDGVEITRLTDNGNAHDYLKTGMILKSINNYTIGDADDYSSAVRSLTPNKTVSILTDQGSYSFKLKSNPANHSLGYMGIQAKAHYLINDNYSNKFYSPYLWVLLDLPELFMWIFLLNFSIGTFNLLPMKPLDGGALFEDLISYVASDDTVKIASQFMTYLMAITIIVSLVYSFTGGLV